MATTNDNVNKELEALRKDLASLRDDIGSLSKAVKAAGEEKGEAAYRRVREKGEELRQQGESAVEKVGHKIDEKPVTSVLTAFGTGVLVGLMLMMTQRRD